MEQQQWQKLCEWSGFKQELIKLGTSGREMPKEEWYTIWVYPDRIQHEVVVFQSYDILFKWMVPKFIKEVAQGKVVSVLSSWIDKIRHNEDPFEILAYAIYKTLQE